MRFFLSLVLAAFVVGLGADAGAIIGRPLTPLSYAGVARRTVRRTAYAAPVAVGAAVGTAAVVGTAAAAGTAAAVHATPYYSGGTVVYVR